MKKVILPVVLLCVGVGSGVGAGLMLKQEPDKSLDAAVIPAANGPCGDTAGVPSTDAPVTPLASDLGREFAPLEKQFIVPVMQDEKLVSMALLSLSLEVPPGDVPKVYAAEPRLRDQLLQDMFNHASIGGFSGNYTDASKMRILRQKLLESARNILGPTALDILILEINRQDL